MGLAKKETATLNGEPTPSLSTQNTKPESGTDAAIERLKKASIPEAVRPSTPKQRDFDAEARGKTQCVMFAAALQSPAIAGLPFKTIEDFLKLVELAAETGVKYSFKD